MYNNKLLAVVFIGLFALYAVTKVVKANRGSRSFKSQIASVDTSLVQSMVLNPQAEQQKEIKFIRGNQGWVLQRGKLQVPADVSKLKSALAGLRIVRPERLVANSKAKWGEYQLTDSLATRIKLLGANGQELLHLLIGKTGVGESYVRLPNENEVYGVSGYLATNFNKQFNDWRNQELLNLISGQIEKINFQYVTGQGQDSSLVLEKTKEGWMMGKEKADSAQVGQYLTAIASKRSSQFADAFKPQGNPQFVLTLSGKKMLVKGKPTPQVIVQGFEAGNDVYLRSSINPASVFKSSRNKGLFAEIFKQKNDFLKKEEEKKEVSKDKESK